MAWVRIHDNAVRHPKIAPLIDWNNPFCVWVWGLSYAQEHLTDGRVVKAALPHPKALRVAERVLVPQGLWVDQGDSFHIHDYLQWNDSKETVIEKREQARNRAKRHRGRNALQSDDETRNERRTSSSGVSVEEGSDRSTIQNAEGVQGEPSEAERRHVEDRRLALRRSRDFGRIFLHRWQIDALIATLGDHAEAFDLDVWLDALNQSIAGKALPPDPWKFVKAELDAEIRRRGLAVAESAAAPHNKRIAGLVAGGEAFLRRQAERKARGQA